MTGIFTAFKYFLFFFLIGFAVVSCHTSKNSAVIPTYVYVDSFAFNSLGGKNSTHQINSVWAFYNNSPIGVFDLPANIPVITEGRGVLTLRPGISVSGLNDFLASYPFYVSDTSTLTPLPGKTVHYVPVTGYYNSTKFKVIADFNSTVFTSSFDLFEGSAGISTSGGIGVISLTSGKDTLSEDSSTLRFPIPLGKDAYIEFDYKCTIPFAVGLRANLGSIYTKYYLSGINPSDHWQKFYLSVKDFEAQYQAGNYNLYIKTTLPSGLSTGTVLLDNIQLVYFD